MPKFNSFKEYGITDYKQYKNFPFLESESIGRIKSIMFSQIRDGFRFPERMLLMGEPGIGKTTSLFFINDLLKDSGKCNVFLLSNFFSSAEEFKELTGKNMREVTKDKTYILIDFPDTLTTKRFKEFLDFLWILMTKDQHENINFIFALNISHYDLSKSFSEILGKFDKLRLERMNLEETKSIIKSRLVMAESPEFFEDDVMSLIFKYSKGIPRNIICASRALVDYYFDKEKVTFSDASKILKEEYISQILKDRIEDPNKREEYNIVIRIISEDFGGVISKQEALIETLKDKKNFGRNKAIGIISNLAKYGLITLKKGGEKNNKKLIYLN